MKNSTMLAPFAVAHIGPCVGGHMFLDANTLGIRNAYAHYHIVGRHVVH